MSDCFPKPSSWNKLTPSPCYQLQILTYQEDILEVFCRPAAFLQSKPAICEANFHSFTGFEYCSLLLECSEMILIESKS